MAIDVTSVVTGMLARNRGPDPVNPGERVRPDYGVNAALDGDILRIVLTFRAGSAYCCGEWGCHLPLNEGKRWAELRRLLAADRVVVPPRLTLRLSCVIEAGALFFDPSRPDPSRRGWCAFRPWEADEYEVSTVEAADEGDG